MCLRLGSFCFVGETNDTNTYRQGSQRLELGLRWRFQLLFWFADIKYPTLGADILPHFGLLVNISHRRLVYGTTSFFVPGFFCPPSAIRPSFCRPPLNNFSNILPKVPELPGPSRLYRQIKHSVTHYKLTTGPPFIVALAMFLLNRFGRALSSNIVLSLGGLDRLLACGLRHYVWYLRKLETDGTAAIIVILTR